MILRTTYFAALRHAPRDFVPLSIALWPPNGFTGEIFRPFCPPPFLIRAYKGGGMSVAEYTEIFTRDILDALPEKSVLEANLARHGEKLLLCCYEKPGDFCHRHLIAKRLSEMGFDCREYAKAQKSPVQVSLF